MTWIPNRFAKLTSSSKTPSSNQADHLHSVSYKIPSLQNLLTPYCSISSRESQLSKLKPWDIERHIPRWLWNPLRRTSTRRWMRWWDTARVPGSRVVGPIPGGWVELLKKYWGGCLNCRKKMQFWSGLTWFDSLDSIWFMLDSCRKVWDFHAGGAELMLQTEPWKWSLIGLDKIFPTLEIWETGVSLSEKQGG